MQHITIIYHAYLGTVLSTTPCTSAEEAERVAELWRSWGYVVTTATRIIQ